MGRRDDELAALCESVDYRTVREQPGWRLDTSESNRKAAKYRRGPGEVVMHEGSSGMVALARHLWAINLGRTRRALPPLASPPPSVLPPCPARPRATTSPVSTAPEAWADAKRPNLGSAGWRYLTSERGLPAVADGFREATRGTVWGALRLAKGGSVAGWEMWGLGDSGFAISWHRTLFADVPNDDAASWAAACVAVCQAMGDVLSLAAIENWRDDTAYTSAAGGRDFGTTAALPARISSSTTMVTATDMGQGGELLAGRLAPVASPRDAAFVRLWPTANDWNDQLRAG